MKRVLSIFLAFSLFQTYIFADFVNQEVDYSYNRQKARIYMRNFFENYNDEFYNFDNLGGDCTNFASQIVHFSGVPYTEQTEFPDENFWYYYGSSWGYERTSTFTSALEFRKHFGDVLDNGVKRGRAMETYTVNQAILQFDDIWKKIKVGDIISHGHTEDGSYHTQIVYEFGIINRDIKVAQHSIDALNRSLFEYLLYRQKMGQGDEFVFIIYM